MEVKNKYVRCREETGLGPAENPPKKVEATSAKEARASALPALEKNKAPTHIALPGGAARRLDYQGPLSERELDRVQQLYPVYKQAEEKTQVNWKVLAGIHYRESSLGLDPQAKGNEFQFDGDLKNKANGDLLHDLVEAGNTLQTKAMNGLYSAKSKKFLVSPTDPLRPQESDGENVRTAAFLYNGPVYRTRAAAGAAAYDRSPYVLNRLDKSHWDMGLYRGKNAKPVWGTDRRLGVIPFARELEKAFMEPASQGAKVLFEDQL